jgi:ABC-type phosphate transport system substrate-binding protein
MSAMRGSRTILLLAWLVLGASLMQAKQLAVVTDSANTTVNLTSAEIVKIFNQRTRSWPDGRPIVLVVRDPGCAEMQLVLRKLFNMSPDQAREFVQAHKGAIVVADSDDSVLRFVSTHGGALGVVDLYSLTKGVTVLKIDGKLPVEQGYLLRGN